MSRDLMKDINNGMITLNDFYLIASFEIKKSLLNNPQYLDLLKKLRGKSYVVLLNPDLAVYIFISKASNRVFYQSLTKIVDGVTSFSLTT